MTLFVFSNYNLIHNNIPTFTIGDYNDLNMTFNELHQPKRKMRQKLTYFYTF